MKPLLNVNRAYCPTCAERMPFFRIPTSLRQALRGGWTCPRCRIDLDRWGRALPPRRPDQRTWRST